MGLIHVPKQLSMLNGGIGHVSGQGLQRGSHGCLKVASSPAQFAMGQKAFACLCLCPCQLCQLPPQGQDWLLHPFNA